MSTRLLQLKNGDTRRVALVQEPHLRLLAEVSSVYQLANIAVAAGVKLSETARQRATQERLDYDPIYEGASDWRILPTIDRLEEPARCLVSGTGLTHLGSARDRQAMHAHTANPEKLQELTDSMKVFRWVLTVAVPRPAALALRPNGLKTESWPPVQTAFRLIFLRSVTSRLQRDSTQLLQ